MTTTTTTSHTTNRGRRLPRASLLRFQILFLGLTSLVIILTLFVHQSPSTPSTRSAFEIVETVTGSEEDWRTWVAKNLDVQSDGSLTDNLLEMLAQAPPDPGLRAGRVFDGARQSKELKFLRVPSREFCQRRPFVVVVYTAVENFQKRRAIRETYGRMQFMPADMFRLVFVVGTKTEDASIHEQWQKEADRYQDFLQYDSPDAYDGLSTKGVAWMRFLEGCKAAPIVVKLDDDVLMAPWYFVTHMKELLRTHKFDESTIMCYVFSSNELTRDAGSKWFIPQTAVRATHFPPYCNGPVIIMPTSRLGEYYRLATRLPYLHTDDAFFTGFLREHLGMQLLSMGDALQFVSNESITPLLEGKQAFATVEPERYYDIWLQLDALYANQSSIFMTYNGSRIFDV